MVYMQSWAHATTIATIWRRFQAQKMVACHIFAKYCVILHFNSEKANIFPIIDCHSIPNMLSRCRNIKQMSQVQLCWVDLTSFTYRQYFQFLLWDLWDYK